MGPNFFSVNIGISRSFTFGNVPAPHAGAAAAGPSTAPSQGTQAANTKSPAANANAKPSSGPTPEKRYNVTFSVNIQNLLNRTNLSQPISNLSSPNLGNRLRRQVVSVLGRVAAQQLETEEFSCRLDFHFRRVPISSQI